MLLLEGPWHRPMQHVGKSLHPFLVLRRALCSLSDPLQLWSPSVLFPYLWPRQETESSEQEEHILGNLGSPPLLVPCAYWGCCPCSKCHPPGNLSPLLEGRGARPLLHPSPFKTALDTRVLPKLLGRRWGWDEAVWKPFHL